MLRKQGISSIFPESDSLLMEAQMSLANIAIYEHDSSRALELYSHVKTPQAAWNQSQVLCIYVIYTFVNDYPRFSKHSSKTYVRLRSNKSSQACIHCLRSIIFSYQLENLKGKPWQSCVLKPSMTKLSIGNIPPSTGHCKCFDG